MKSVNFLDGLLGLHMFENVVHGAARGADTIAANWARENGLRCYAYPADWTRHGRSAGHIRNRQMLNHEDGIDLVVAFPGGKGTAGMIKLAEKANIPVIRHASRSHLFAVGAYRS